MSGDEGQIASLPLIPTFTTSNPTLQIYLDLLAASKIEYDDLWRQSQVLNKSTDTDDKWETATVDFERIAGARCRTILMFSSLSKVVPGLQENPQYAFTPVQNKAPVLDWPEVDAIGPPIDGSDGRMKSKLEVQHWISTINRVVHSKLFMDYNNMDNIARQRPMAMDRITTNDTRFHNGFTAFANLLKGIANRKGPVSVPVLEGPRFVPSAPKRGEIWTPTDWHHWDRDENGYKALFLDTVEQQGNLWFLNQRVTPTFLRRRPEEHLMNFWKHEQDLAIISNCVFPDDRFKGGERELTTDDQPGWVDAVEMAIGMIPYVGNAVSLGELIAQHNLFDYRLTKFDMAMMAVFLFFPAAGKLFKPIARFNKAIEAASVAIISKVFKITVSPITLIWGVVRKFLPMLGHAWNVIRSALIWTTRELFYLPLTMLEAIEKRWAHCMEYLAILAKIFQQPNGLHADLSFASSAIKKGTMGYEVAQEVAVAVSTVAKQEEKALLKGGAAKASKPAKVVQKEAMRLLIEQYPVAVQTIFNEVEKEFPHLMKILGPDSIQRIMEKFPSASGMRGHIVEEVMAFEITKIYSQRYGRQYAGKSTDIAMEFIGGHRIRSLKNSDITDGISAVLLPGDKELEKEGFDGLVHIYEIAETKLTYLDELRRSKTSITGPYDLTNSSFRRVIVDMYEHYRSTLPPGAIAESFDVMEQKFAQELKPGGQVVNDLLRIVKDGGLVINGKRYKVVIPFSNVTHVKIRCFTPGGVLTPAKIKNFIEDFKKRGLPNVEVAELASINQIEIERIVEILATQMVKMVKENTISLAWVPKAKLVSLIKKIEENAEKLAMEALDDYQN